MSRLERVIFVAGAGHSGSTLIGCALGACPDNSVFHAGECYAFFEPGTLHGNTDGKPLWRDINPDVVVPYREIASATGARIIVDFSKRLPWLRHQAEACRDVSLSVVISYRPFERIVASSLKRGRPHGRAAGEVIRYYRNMIAAIDDLRPVHAITADVQQFCTDPARELRRLCSALSLPYFVGKERYWEFPSHHLFGASVQRKQFDGRRLGGYNIPPASDAPEARQLLSKHRNHAEIESKIQALVLDS